MELEIEGISVKEPPNRALEIRCKIKSDQNNDVAILQLWAKIRATKKYLTLIEGPYFRYCDMPVIPHLSSGIFTMLIPLDEKVLNSLEAAREGDDLHLEIESTIVMSPITQSPLPSGFPANKRQLRSSVTIKNRGGVGKGKPWDRRVSLFERDKKIRFYLMPKSLSRAEAILRESSSAGFGASSRTNNGKKSSKITSDF